MRLHIKAARAGLLALLLALAACVAGRPPPTIEPISAFSGRLLVMEPTRRWQTIIDWRAERPEQGWLRLLHPTSGRIVELRWSADGMWMRDSYNADPRWRAITRRQLQAHGLSLMPQQLAAFLLGRPPAGFHRLKARSWRDALGRTVLWRSRHRLEFADSKHGLRAVLIIGREGASP